MKLYNTLTRKVEEFEPLNPPEVTFYSCGPTVYDYTHIGHARTYVNNDILKRTLNYLGYKVRHVMNITDVGHLTGDDDTGVDKLEKGAKKTGKTVWEVAEFYTKFFERTIKDLNIIFPDKLIKATDYVDQMIQLIKQLNQKGFAYETGEAIYFDVTKFKNYGKLSGQKLEDKKQKAREEVNLDSAKKHPADFALWFKRVGRFADHQMHWPSSWGEGFPGWHIECSAIAMKELGETVDIHAGGIDHIPVHHENEIAQSEAATEKPFVRYFFHNEFLLVEGKKMSKSLNNFYTLDDLSKKGIEPAALRLLFLQTHYRQQMNFTWESAAAAQEALNKLRDTVLELKKNTETSGKGNDYQKEFKEALSNDLQTPQAVASMWKMLKSDLPAGDKLNLLFEFDQILGLGLADVREVKIPDDVKKLLDQREKARKDKDFVKSDELRKQIQDKGYIIEDLDTGYKIKKA
jgi:cysteinyl-tRNA synthetase